MNYHNPEDLIEWGQSDGWRLLTTEEIKQPLPDDAECRRITNGQWHSSTRIGAFGADHITYRTCKPLPVSPLVAQLDAEIKAKQELREIALSVEAGAEWEVDGGGTGTDWHKPDYELKWYLREERACPWQVRLKPKPVTRDWSKPEDVPGPGPCYLRRKDGRSGSGWTMILAANEYGPVVASQGMGEPSYHVALARQPWSYLEKLEHSTDRINWKPCETTEEAK